MKDFNTLYPRRLLKLLILGLSLSTTHGQSKESSVSILQDLMEDPKFSVDFLDIFIAESSLPQFLNADLALPGSDLNSSNQTTSRRLVLRSDKGERFLCDISTPPEQEEHEEPLLSPEDQTRINQEGLNRGVETLNSMKDKCLAMRAGWWTYMFCYNGEVSQFHKPTPDEEVKEGTPPAKYILGSYTHSLPVSSVLSAGEDSEVSKEVKVKENDNLDRRVATVKATPTRNVLVQRWGGGTPCDLNNQLRSVEIHYQCFPGKADQIISIKEPKSCHYLLEIGSPQLCNDSFYAEKNVATIHPIKCAEVVPDMDVEKRQEEAVQRAKTKKELDSAKAKKLKESGSQPSNMFSLLSPGSLEGLKLKDILRGIIKQNQPGVSKDKNKANSETQSSDDNEASEDSEDVYFEAINKILKSTGLDSETDKQNTAESDEDSEYDEL